LFHTNATLAGVLERIASAVQGRDARAVADAVLRLVADGDLAPGTRLPTVRALAARLGLSPTTVAEAWRALTSRGAITTRGRNGTFVADARPASTPRRFWTIARAAGHFALDLSGGVPDAALLPHPGAALGRAAGIPHLTSYLDDPVVPALEAAVRKAWVDVFDPEAFTVVDGALDALDRLLAVLVRAGDRVAVETPGFPPVLDLLEAHGVRPVGVPVGTAGLDVDALERVLTGHRPSVLVIQPRAQNPTGVSTTPAHVRRLAAVLRRHPRTTVLEDVHSGDIASAPVVSLGSLLPDRVVHVKSYSKSHGPDLRLAAVGGPRPIVDALAARRRLGPSWSSRIMQAVLADLLTDEAATEQVQAARTAYAERRRRLVHELTARGVDTPGSDGINLWVPVDDERDALVVLAAQGIGVAPGAPFYTEPAGAPAHVRLTCGVVTDRFAELADAVAAAAHAHGGLHRSPAATS
jgi:DNA-binding transcriptional MocR family regulator